VATAAKDMSEVKLEEGGIKAREGDGRTRYV
jgi:hypothetical protein